MGGRDDGTAAGDCMGRWKCRIDSLDIPLGGVLWGWSREWDQGLPVEVCVVALKNVWVVEGLRDFVGSRCL